MIRYYSVPKETFVTNGTIVEPLTATENGTYAPPAGTAYSPVIVNVEGGGGSSDFSTAEVTIINNTANELWVIIPHIVYDEFEGVVEDYLDSQTRIWENNSITINALLYKGYGGGQIFRESDKAVISAGMVGTGGVEVDASYINITGNGTITIS